MTSPVVVPPCKALRDQLLALEGLHELDDMQVGHALNLRVALKVEVLLSLQHTLCRGGAAAGEDQDSSREGSAQHEAHAQGQGR